MSPRSRLVLALLCATGFVAAPAAAHVERPAYWPDPAVDNSVAGGTGGKVPALLTLSSALVRSRPGDTRVVCQSDSMTRLQESMTRARAEGYCVRPSERRKLTKARPAICWS